LSTIKIKIDAWYASNIVGKTDTNGKAITDYISDEVFCNDRSVYDGSGYLLSPPTTYNSAYRLSKHKPKLLCGQDSDKFRVANGNLTYPVALITLDEASLAGGKNDNLNDKYYLYTGQSYWTMSPSSIYSKSGLMFGFYINSDGRLLAWNVSSIYGIRPVINLKSNVKITKGTGTASNPYELTIE